MPRTTKEKALENLNNIINDLSGKIDALDVVLQLDDCTEQEKMSYSAEKKDLEKRRDGLRAVLESQNEQLAIKTYNNEENEHMYNANTFVKARYDNSNLAKTKINTNTTTLPTQNTIKLRTP